MKPAKEKDPAQELEEGVEELRKAAGMDDVKDEKGEKKEKEPEEDTPLGLVGKALDVVQGALGLKKSVADGAGEPPQPDLKKAGEDRQEHGEQNQLNTGPMNRKDKMAKIYDYLSKMDDAELDEYANAMVTAQYRDEERGVHKSLEDRLEGTHEGDQAMIVNEFLEDTAATLASVKKSQTAVLKGLSAILELSKQAIEKSNQAGQLGRGRKSKLDIATKGLGGGENLGADDWTDTMHKAQKAVQTGHLTAADVSMLELAMNNGGQPNPQIMQVLQTIQ